MFDINVKIKIGCTALITRIRMEEGGDLVLTYQSQRHDALDRHVPPDAVSLMMDLFQNGARALSAEELELYRDTVKLYGLARPKERVIVESDEPIGLTPTGWRAMMVVCTYKLNDVT